jgi:hypothetical protein
MALSILDGKQSATTLSSVVTGGEHIVAHSVVSLGTQAIANITSAISGTSVCVGSISISGTPSVTGSVSVLNFPASQATTFGAVTGSVSVLNFPVSQSVTFSAVTGSLSVLNFPASQTVTFGQAIVSASNITGLNNSVGTDGNTPTSTNFIKIGGHQDGANQVEHIVHVSAGGAMKVDASDSTVTFGVIRGTVTIGNSITIGSLPAISGTVTANVSTFGAFGGTLLDYNGANTVLNVGIQKIGNASLNLAPYLPVEVYIASNPISASNPVPSRILIGTGSGSAVSAGNPMPISGTVTIGAGTAQIGSVTASISGTVPVSGTFFQATQPASLASLPALAAGTAQIGSVTASISGTVPISISSVTVGNSVTIGSLPAISGTVTANTFALQGTAVTTSNFTSTTASTVLANYNATREVLTIFNEGAGNLHIAPGATCTTIAYQVRLSAGDYYEVPNHQTTITHSAVYGTAGTARVTEVS